MTASGRKRRGSSSISISSFHQTRRGHDVASKRRHFQFSLSSSQANVLRTPKKIVKHPCTTLMEKLHQKKFIKDFMPKSQMFVIVTQIHKTAKDFLEKYNPELPLFCYVYDYLMNKYGIKKIADKKFRQF